MSTRKKTMLIMLSLLHGACTSNLVQDTYYSLSLGKPHYPAEVPEEQRSARLTLTHVTLPRFLDKQNLVMQNGAHTLVSAHHHFWAEPLEDGIAKVLVQEIMHVSKSLRVERNAGRWASKGHCSLRLEFDAFHPTEAGQVISSGRFWLQGSEKDNVVVQTFSYSDNLLRDGYPQVVEQLRASLQNVASTIVTSIEQNHVCN